jgi:signal transduction histidine kinase/ActR/RegA family two-component response regulator
MQQAYADTSSGWAVAVRQRRKALIQRLGMGAASALVFSPLLGWTFSVLWVAAYFLIQLLDMMVFSPINSGKTDQMGLVRSSLGGLMLFLNAGFFGSLSIPLWISAGPMGGICAAILLSAAAIYSVVNSPGSSRVLACALAPQLLYLGATPIFMAKAGAPAGFVTAAAISVLVFATYCISTWQRLNKSATAERQARVEADRKRADAERAMASRSAFLAAVGHDLRTPIGAILTGAAEVERGGDSQARAQAALITDAGLMMKALLDDLLDHAKLDAGRMTVEETDFNLRGLIAQTLKLWQGPARAKGLRLRLDGAHTLPGAVRGDPMRVRQILNNLISNAMKFTDAGSITLRLNAWDEEPGGHALLIEIVDTGQGMSAEQMARLFTPFDQTADGVGARHGGTGLGLAISRDLAELMGGRLTARSAPGQGSVFTLAIVLGRGEIVEVAQTPMIDADRAAVARALSTAMPARPVSAPAPLPEVVADAAPTAALIEEEEPQDRPLSVLIVDDHDINRRAIQLILQPLGCDIAMAAEGLAALAACEERVFDVIFMDVRMPELDGRETTRRLRSSGGPNAQTPVIAVTADSAPEDIAACTAAGMAYFVSKPLTPPSLLGALAHVMNDLHAEVEDSVAA